MNTTNTHTCTSRHECGFTLVEIMVAMVLSLILLGGVLQIFTSTNASYRINESVAEMQETGRFAIEALTRDIRMADFWGCAEDITKLTNGLDSTGTGYIDFASGGLNGTEGASGAPDTLVLRGGFGTGAAVLSPFGPQSSADIWVAAGNGFAVNDILLVSDCLSADIFQVTGGDPNGNGNLVHMTGGTTAPGNANSIACTGTNTHCLSKVYDNTATVYKARQVTYSIGTGTSGEPALMRNGQELIDNIEDMQVLYGEDTDNSGTANRYVTADNVGDMDNVVSLRIALVTRSSRSNVAEGNQNYTVLGASRTGSDGRLRQTYTATIGIRNRLK